MEKNNNPNFFIVGPPKCASTSLHYYLNQHPDITLSEIKETHFFSLDYSEGIQSYLQKHFKNANTKIIGEADPTYSFLFYPLLYLKENFPDAKLLYCLRNPVERAFSGWCMREAMGVEVLSFRKALENNALAREKFTFKNNNSESVWINEQRQIKTSNKLTIPTYIDAGLYGEMLKFAFSLFPKEQIKVIKFKDLSSNINETLREIYDFLEVDNNVLIQDISTKNKYNKHNLKFLYNIFGKKRIIKLLKLFPESIGSKFKGVVFPEAKKPKLSDEDRKFAYQFFKDDIEVLENLLGKSFEEWKVK